jgi:hypothetical protein
MAIDHLIDKQDGFEIVRDKIAAILLAESASQSLLAEEADKDPNQWLLRVFVERSNPWEEFLDLPGTEENPTFAAPIVNVSVDSLSYDMSHGNVVERQRCAGTFNIDCFGYGVAANVEAGGHEAGDQAAALACQRTVRLVRNILMSATYTYLGDQRKANQFIWRRWLPSVQFYQPQLEGRAMQQVMAARMQLQVEFNEVSPQVTGAPLEVLTVSVKKAPNGELVLATTQFGEEPAPEPEPDPEPEPEPDP